MKLKGTTLAALLLSFALLLSGCSPLVDNVPQTKNIYTTFYPIYALTEAVCPGIENVETHCLVQPQDGCIRSYKLSDWDLYMLAYSADAIISAGNGLESFSAQLQTLGETSLPLAEVMYGLDLFQMDAVSEEDSHFAGTNPHLYMSVSGAEALVENISGAMSVFDEANAELYEANYGNVCKKLEEAREFIRKKTEVCKNVPTAILNEAAFYTATDCGLGIVGSYPRENSEMLYGDHLQNCLDALAEMDAKVVLLESQAPSALIEALESAGFAVAKLNTMSALSEKDGAQAYFEVLKENAESVAAACGKVLEQREDF